MIGIDITAIGRFKRSTESLSKILSTDERLEYNKVKNKVNYLAGRWAAKEAVFKAAGLNNAIILSRSNGSPYVKDREDIVVSISHERAYAVAVAVQKT